VRPLPCRLERGDALTSAAEASRPRLDRLVVTRPAGEAERWAQALLEHGWPAQVLSLIGIDRPQSPLAQQALQRARYGWSRWDALMFVSSAAVKHFFGSGEGMPAGTAGTRFWAPGPGTGAALAEALKMVGVSADRIDAPPGDARQFDSETLWPVVRDQVVPGKRVLIVRGTSPAAEAAAPRAMHAGQGRDWLIQQCEQQGATVQTCVAYERCPPVWDASLRAQALAAAQPGSVWLLSSSEAVDNLRVGLPEANWAQAAALATHERIADAAREAGFGEVRASRPALPDVLRALESQWSHP
jgi:uroporphyrinogen-III synthase